jgi:inner membrane protein
LIDAFNNYGVGWFEPFSHKRISFNAIYVADPFFSLWPGLALGILLILKRHHPARKKIWQAGLLLSAFYLLYCLSNKSTIDTEVKNIFRKQNINYTRYFTTPAPLQNWLWYVVAGNDSGYYTGYRSLFDSRDTMSFQYFPRNADLLKPVYGSEELTHLIRFSQNFYTVENWNDTLVFNDLRFGQVLGWQSARGKFAFHYYLQNPGTNKLVIQRGRFEGWNWQTASAFWNRIKGN